LGTLARVKQENAGNASKMATLREELARAESAQAASKATADSLRQAMEQLDECLHCFELKSAKGKTALVPCGHELCSDCAIIYMAAQPAQCPTCRQPIDRCQKIYA